MGSREGLGSERKSDQDLLHLQESVAVDVLSNDAAFSTEDEFDGAREWHGVVDLETRELEDAEQTFQQVQLGWRKRRVIRWGGCLLRSRRECSPPQRQRKWCCSPSGTIVCEQSDSRDISRCFSMVVMITPVIIWVHFS